MCAGGISVLPAHTFSGAFHRDPQVAAGRAEIVGTIEEPK